MVRSALTRPCSANPSWRGALKPHRGIIAPPFVPFQTFSFAFRSSFPHANKPTTPFRRGISFHPFFIIFPLPSSYHIGRPSGLQLSLSPPLSVSDLKPRSSMSTAMSRGEGKSLSPVISDQKKDLKGFRLIFYKKLTYSSSRYLNFLIFFFFFFLKRPVSTGKEGSESRIRC